MLEYYLTSMDERDVEKIEAVLSRQVQVLQERLESTIKRRQELEAHVNRLRAKLRADEARLEQERERERALETAFKMAELARKLASGGQLEHVDVSAFVDHREDDWKAMTIAEACQRALQRSLGRPMSNKELRETLLLQGKDVPVGSIATTLERYREIFVKVKQGNTTYWSLKDERMSTG
jgi:translation initiation factor 2 beta subunit (eIF-2beta)/eIF-5